MVEVENEEDRDHSQREHFANREHELPAVAHDLALALGHRLHDVGVAGRDIASERYAQQEANDDEPTDARHDGLYQRQDDEQHHRHQKHDAPADLVGQPAADQGANERAALGAGRRETQQQRIRLILFADEYQDEGNGIKVPGFDEDRGHHQPSDLVALGAVLADQIADGAIHRRALWKSCRRHFRYSPWFFVGRFLGVEQRLDAAIQQARIDAGFHSVEHGVHEVDQRVGRGDGTIDAPVREGVEDHDMTIDRA